METVQNSLISVVMPVFNARKYIERAIESVLQQSYTQFELILVDDGATDGSGEVCDGYALQDSRVIVVHQKNGGISNARNRALQIAQGKYIAFCDHDDEMLPNALENAVTAMEAKHVEMVKFAYQHDCYSFDQLISTGTQILPEQRYSLDELVDHYDLFFAAVRVLWNGLYLSSLIKDNGISFDESVRFGMEDFLFNIKYLEYARTVVFLSEKGYIHYDRYEQSTDEKYDDNKLFAREKAAVVEKEFLKRKNVRPDTWIRHQIAYLSMYLVTLNHPDCHLSFKEKRSKLKQLNTPQKLSLNCGLVNCFILKSNPKQMIIVLLFNLRLYSVLLWVYSTFSQRYKRFLKQQEEQPENI